MIVISKYTDIYNGKSNTVLEKRISKNGIYYKRNRKGLVG